MQVPPSSKEPQKPRPPVAEMFGATSAPFHIGAHPVQIVLPVHPPSGPALLQGEVAARKIGLKLENVTCPLRAPTFAVYLNVPPGEDASRHPELFAGSMGMFGLPEASREDGRHSASGMNFVMEVTNLYVLLSTRRDWDPKNLRLTFVAGDWDAPVPDVQVGRASLYLL